MQVTCKVCDKGSLQSLKIHRASGPVVAIGYILLIPSILGVLGAIGIFALTLGGSAGVVATGDASSIDEVYRRNLEEAGVPTAVIDQVLAEEEVDLDALPEDQRRAVTVVVQALPAARYT